MNGFEHKVDLVISATVAILSAIFGQLWFLFAFLLLLNILDCITGTMKARYLKVESSKEGLNGIARTLYTWILIIMSFGLSIMFIEIGEHLNKNLSFMMCIGWFVLTHCIINEIRSILENLIQMDKGECIPNWLIRGLKVTQDFIDKKANSFVDKIENGVNKEEKKDG